MKKIIAVGLFALSAQAFAQSAPVAPAAPAVTAAGTPAHDYQPPISWQERREKMLTSLNKVLACIEAANSEDTLKGCAKQPPGFTRPTSPPADQTAEATAYPTTPKLTAPTKK